MPFVPTDYNGVFLWLKSDALALSNSDPVSSWTDSGPLAKHAVQASGSLQPLYKTGIVNGQPAVLFDGVDDGLQTATIDLTNWEGATVFMVCQPVGVPASAASGIMVESSATVSTVTNVGAIGMWINGFSGGGTVYNAAFEAGDGVSQYASWTSPVVGTPVLLTFQGAVPPSRANVKMAVNGDWRGEYTADTKRLGTRSRYMTSQPWNLGARNNGASSFFSGYICELLCYRKLLSYDRRLTVEQYLATKYGLTLTATGAIWVLDGHSHVDGDGTTPGAPVRRHWNRVRARIKENIDFHMAARLGTTTEKFADDMVGSQRYLETTFAPKILSTSALNNDIYQDTGNGYGYTVGKVHGLIDMARVAASGATYKTTETIYDGAGAASPVNYCTDGIDYNTVWLPANKPASIETIDIGADANFGVLDGTRATTQWFNDDHIHLREATGYLRACESYWLPWFLSKGFTEWKPTDLSGLVLWLDASTITGLNDGDLVSTWSDLSGNAKHATSAGGLRPTYKTNIFGVSLAPNVAVVRFAGTHGMAIPAIDFTGTSVMTAIVVGTASAAAAAQIWWELSADSDAVTTGAALFRNAAGKADAYLVGNVGQNQVQTTAVSTTPASICAYWDKSQVANAETFTRVNGVDSGTSGATNNTGAFGNHASYLGSKGGAGAAVQLTGDIGMLAVYNRRLTRGELHRLEYYASTKFGIY